MHYCWFEIERVFHFFIHEILCDKLCLTMTFIVQSSPEIRLKTSPFTEFSISLLKKKSISWFTNNSTSQSHVFKNKNEFRNVSEISHNGTTEKHLNRLRGKESCFCNANLLLEIKKKKIFFFLNKLTQFFNKLMKVKLN